MITKITKKIKDYKVQELLDRVQNEIKSYIKELNHPKSEELLSKLATGKMLRSKLILKIAGVSDDSIKLCAVVEMIHAASLLHDDVLDSAMTRRGEASINALYSDHTAIMFGDILYSKAFAQLVTLDKDVAYTIANAVTLLSVGEMIDVELADKFNTDEDVYFDMIYKKTSSLIEAASRASAILANKEADKYAVYGRNLGVSFQIVDDLLDITADEETLGKPAMSDLKEGKVTLPYIYMYNRCSDEDKDKLISLHKKVLSDEEVTWIRDKMKDTDAISDTFDYVKRLCNEAIEIISSEDDTKELIDIMKQMTEREF
jgi:octaprenyl-diphosphate synthase